MGKVFQWNGKAKCDSEFNKEEILSKEWTLAFIPMSSYSESTFLKKVHYFGVPVSRDTMDLNASVHSLDKRSSLLNSESHLALPFHWKTFPKTYISLLIWTFFLTFVVDEFFFRRWRRGADDRQIKTNDKCQKKRVQIKS